MGGNGIELWDVSVAQTPKLNSTLSRDKTSFGLQVLRDVPLKTGQSALVDTDITCLAWSPDGRTLATGNYPGAQITLWDLQTGKPNAVLDGHDERITSVAFSPDGTTLATTSMMISDGKLAKHGAVLQLWNLTTNQSIGAYKTWPFSADKTMRWMSSVTFRPDGKTLASGCFDGTVKLWNVPELQKASKQ